MSNQYTPPYRIASGILHNLARNGEALSRLRLPSDDVALFVLRRGNRIKMIQASLAIEGRKQRRN
jgi:hypothetical protein